MVKIVYPAALADPLFSRAEFSLEKRYDGRQTFDGRLFYELDLQLYFRHQKPPINLEPAYLDADNPELPEFGAFLARSEFERMCRDAAAETYLALSAAYEEFRQLVSPYVPHEEMYGGGDDSYEYLEFC
jgi:hypothetical protein